MVDADTPASWDSFNDSSDTSYNGENNANLKKRKKNAKNKGKTKNGKTRKSRDREKDKDDDDVMFFLYDIHLLFHTALHAFDFSSPLHASSLPHPPNKKKHAHNQ